MVNKIFTTWLLSEELDICMDVIRYVILEYMNDLSFYHNDARGAIKMIKAHPDGHDVDDIKSLIYDWYYGLCLDDIKFLWDMIGELYCISDIFSVYIVESSCKTEEECWNGLKEMLYLVGGDVNKLDGYDAMRWAMDYCYLNIMKWLWKMWGAERIDIHKDRDRIFKDHCESYSNNIECLEWLCKNTRIDIRTDNDYGFIAACDLDNYNIVEWFCEKCEHYWYKKDDNGHIIECGTKYKL